MGLAFMLAGLFCTVAGVGGSTQLDLQFKDYKAHTDQVGLAIILIGAAFTALLLILKPTDVHLMAKEDEPEPFLVRHRRNLTIGSLIAAGAAVVLLAATFR